MLKPQFGDLKHVQGGFVTGLGKFQAEWKILDDEEGARGGGYELSWNVPEGTRGTVVLPGVSVGNGSAVVVIVQGGLERSRVVGEEELVLEVDGGMGNVLVQVEGGEADTTT